MICMFISTSCEKADLQKPTALKHVEGRGGCPIQDCDECPDNDCCCSIELLSIPQGGVPVALELCGTSGPCLSTMSCSAGGVGMCPDINGFVENITLIGQGSTAMFCVPQNSPFGIILASPTTQTHQVRLTCQAGQTPPNTVTITLNQPPNKPYWQTNGECELTSCF